MNDKQLLELAAKAAGLRFAINGDDLPGYIAANNDDWRYGWCYWNPLEDDGDALRLAVKLQEVMPNRQFDLCIGTAASVTTVQEYHNGDPYAATRRAIVRAAAAIAQEKQG